MIKENNQYILVHLKKVWLLPKQNKNKNFAPSPPSLPIIGHLHFLNDGSPPYNNFLSNTALIFSLRFGFRSVLIVSSPTAVEECFTKNDLNFANRPRFLSEKLLNYNFTTIGSAPYGTLWKNLRRFTTTEIFSNTRLNESLGMRKEEVKLLLKDLCAISSCHDFVEVEMKSKLSELSFNIIMMVVAGKRYFGDKVENVEDGRHFRELIEEMVYLSGASNPGDFLPFLQWIDYQGLEKRMTRLQREFDAFLQGLIDEFRDKPFGVESTLIESMLELQKSEPEFYSDTIIKGVILVLLMAGTDTTAVTMEWAMTLLVNHPNVLKKARVELENNVGHNRLVDESDISKLPYLQGIVKETLRLYAAVPLLVPREAIILIRLGMMDWKMKIIYKFKLIPFGHGRRRCPGSSLANREVTLALAAMIQCFQWERVGEELVDMAEGMGLSMPKAMPLKPRCRVRKEMREVLLEL